MCENGPYERPHARLPRGELAKAHPKHPDCACSNAPRFNPYSPERIKSCARKATYKKNMQMPIDFVIFHP